MGTEPEPALLYRDRPVEGVLRDLASQHGCNQVLIEGGGTVLGSFFAGGFVDRVVAYLAPLWCGGGALSGSGSSALPSSVRLTGHVGAKDRRRSPDRRPGRSTSACRNRRWLTAVWAKPARVLPPRGAPFSPSSRRNLQPDREEQRDVRRGYPVNPVLLPEGRGLDSLDRFDLRLGASTRGSPQVVGVGRDRWCSSSGCGRPHRAASGSTFVLQIGLQQLDRSPGEPAAELVRKPSRRASRRRNHWASLPPPNAQRRPMRLCFGKQGALGRGCPGSARLRPGRIPPPARSAGRSALSCRGGAGTPPGE